MNESAARYAPCARRTLLLLALMATVLLSPRVLPAEDDIVRFVETKRAELKEKEESLKREEVRLTALRKDVDDRIAAYTKLLAQTETALKRIDTVQNEKLDSVIKAYETMTPADAAARLTALDQETALRILARMKSKKAGAIMSAMTPHQAAVMTKNLTTPALGNARKTSSP
jgi:flagellar motility protein MotE (MotC chaperone)